MVYVSLYLYFLKLIAAALSNTRSRMAPNMMSGSTQVLSFLQQEVLESRCKSSKGWLLYARPS